MATLKKTMVCHRCPGGTGCKTCSSSTVGGTTMTTCTACYTTLGYALESVTKDGKTMDECVQKKCTTEANKYWNGSA